MTTALLIIDMINDFNFSEGDKLYKSALPVARNIKRLKAKFKKEQRPVIYVNDNFGKWKASWQEVFDKCSASKGREISLMLKPDKDDYFVLKPKHSGFYSTNLDVLLEELGVEKLILTGIAGNICVLFTANDAYMRGYKIHVPENCIASNTAQMNNFVIKQLSEVFNINIKRI